MSAITDFEPTGASFEDVYGFLAAARKENPLFYSQNHKGWIVTRYEDVLAVVRNPAFTVENALQGAQNGQYCPEANKILSGGVDWNKTRHVQTDDSPEHPRFRRALMSVITPKRVREMEPVVRRLVNELIDSFIKKGECEYVSEFAYPLAMLTTLNLIGFHEAEDDLSKFPVWIDDTFRMLLTNLSVDQQVVAATHAVEFQNYIRQKIESRRANPQNDLLSEILTNLSTGAASLTDDELVIMLTHSLVGAGHETTKLALTNSVFHLLSHRERWEELIRDRSRVGEFAEECLRFDAPLLAWFRYCVQDCEIGGKLIRKGDKVVIMYGSANHDSERFSDGDSFCPVRTKKAPILTFNTGKHSCVGAPMARLELYTALEEISARIPGIRLRPNQKIEYAPSFGNRVISKLFLEWDTA